MTDDLPPGSVPPSAVPPSAVPSGAVPSSYSAQGPAQPLSAGDERLYMTLADIGGIFFSFIPATIVYFIAKDRSDFVRRNSASALSFQFTMVIANVVGVVLWTVGIGFLINTAVGVLLLIFSIIAAVAANRGADYRYPLSIPLVK